jgi:hypothetical protein
LDAAGGLCCLDDILGWSASGVTVDSIKDDAASLAMNQTNLFADDAFAGQLLDLQKQGRIICKRSFQ